VPTFNDVAIHMCFLVFWNPGLFPDESFVSMAASENPFSNLVTDLPKPEGGSYGKYYSLTKLNDPRLGEWDAPSIQLSLCDERQCTRK